MRIFVKFILVILLLFPLEAFAKPVVAVLSVDSNTVATYSYILNNTSAMIAEDTINNFRKGYSFEAKKLLTEKLPQREIAPLQTSYADAGYVDYDLLDKLNKTVKADYILLLTSYMDIQSHLLDETVWNMLNIAGLDTFSSKYYLYTHATFWNAKDKTVVWEKMYENKLSADDFNIVNPVSTPNYTQIKNVKKISNHIAKDIVLKSKILVFGQYSGVVDVVFEDLEDSYRSLNSLKDYGSAAMQAMGHDVEYSDNAGTGFGYIALDLFNKTDMDIVKAEMPYTYFNVYTADQIKELLPGIDIEGYLTKLGIDRKYLDKFGIYDPDQLRFIGEILTEERLDALKAWDMVNLINKYRRFIVYGYDALEKYTTIDYSSDEDRIIDEIYSVFSSETDPIYVEKYYTEEMDNALIEMCDDI